MGLFDKLKRFTVEIFSCPEPQPGACYIKFDYTVLPLDLNYSANQFRAHHSVRFEGRDLKVGLGEDFEMVADDKGRYSINPQYQCEYIFPNTVSSERVLWRQKDREDRKSSETINVVDKVGEQHPLQPGYAITEIPCGVALHEEGFWTIISWRIVSKPPFMVIPKSFKYYGPEYHRSEREMDDSMLPENPDSGNKI